MSAPLREQLRSQVLRAGWDDLAPHLSRGALFVVRDLDLLDVAVAIATDDAAAVTGWLTDGRLRRASDDDAAAWVASPPLFEAVILQPWVVARPLDP